MVSLPVIFEIYLLMSSVLAITKTNKMTKIKIAQLIFDDKAESPASAVGGSYLNSSAPKSGFSAVI